MFLQYCSFGNVNLLYYNKYLYTKWICNNNIYIQVNARGGGEYGEKWHISAIRENRYKTLEDIVCVIKFLETNGVIKSGSIGFMGESSGGWISLNLLVHYPQLLSAVMAKMPISDLKKLTKLGAGNLWTAEYGDPENKKDLEWMLNYSPYHQVKELIKYPPLLVITSSNDDRVHPAHGRKIVALLQQYRNCAYLFENNFLGHTSKDTNEENDIIYEFFNKYLK